MHKRTIACLLVWTSQSLLAIEPPPKESGWHGYVSPNLSALSFRDNQVAGAGSLDIGSKRIESLDEKARKESAGLLSLSAEVGYAFADQGLYLFAGNRLEDFLRLDNSSALGARLDMHGLGILEASALFSSVPTEVWADPYLTGADREDTDRTSGGARLGWARILGTMLEAQVTVRTMELDEERSGEALNLTAAERALLGRDGDGARLEVLYTWVLNERHALVPSLDVGTYDADGDAISRDSAGMQLTHAYRLGRYRLVSNLAFHQSRFDASNPVFDRKQNEDEVVLSTTGFYTRLFDIPRLSGLVSLLYAKRDSRITFFDSEANVASLGMLYNF